MSIYLFTTLPLDKYQGAWWMLCGEDLFTFVTDCQVVFPRGCTILHPHKQWIRVPVALYHCQHLVLSVFGIFTILIHVLWYGLRFFKILVQAEIWSLIRYLLRDYCQFFFSWDNGTVVLFCFSKASLPLEHKLKHLPMK